MKKLSILCAFCFVFSSLAYTSEDVSNATYLADQQIVVKQGTASKYRLDDKILRQEVIAMALKVKGITLPENYKCKKYFTDATKNDWVCRAVELAADNGIISRSNKYVNPGKYVTRAEALAMLWTAGNVDQKLSDDWQITSGLYDAYIIYDDANNWQNELIEKARYLKIISPATYNVKIQIPSMHGEELHVQFYPNRSATRAEVFAFARNILNVGNETGEYCEITGAKVKAPCEITFSEHMGKTIRFGKYTEREIDGYQGPECSLSYFSGSIQDGFNFFGGPSYWQISTKGGKVDAIDMSYEGPAILIFGQDGYYFGGLTNECAQNITFSNVRKIKNSDILILYYKKIKEKDFYFSYSMRSPAGVSLETFESWYKNTESVTFREDTLKDLGNNTYEFLVDMVESGKKSTYKVKSKVNLEKFTIDNISSVKQ